MPAAGDGTRQQPRRWLWMDKDPAKTPARKSAGLVVGGLGGPEDELLDSGQEEVFSRTEVESGHIEHQAETGGAGDDKAGERKRPA